MEEQRAFGSFLRAERELRQIPLGEVATATKIPLRSLQLLEGGQWEDLPAEIFVRGFVRSFARYIGIPEDEACLRYRDIIDQKLRDEQVPDEAAPPPIESMEVGGRRKFGLAIVVIIVLILATITLSLFWRRGAGATTQAVRQTEGQELSSRSV